MRYLKSSLVYFVLLFNYTHSCNNYFPRLFSEHKLHVAALVLARGGSKGIKLKNLSKINNLSLLKISLNAIKAAGGFDSIWISTDHDLIYREVHTDKYVNVHWRSPETATDTAPSILAVQEFIKHHIYADVVALIQCTSPFVNGKFLQQAINFARGGSECTFSVTRSHQLRWVQYGNYVRPINFDPKKRPRRQDWSGELIENGMFYFATRKLIENGYFQSENCNFVEIPKYKSTEIDNIVDLQVAKCIFDLL